MRTVSRSSPRQGKSEAAKRLIFSRRWEGFGSRNQPPLRENALLAGVPADVATSHPRTPTNEMHNRHQATAQVATQTGMKNKRKASCAEPITITHGHSPRASALRASRGQTNGGRP